MSGVRKDRTAILLVAGACVVASVAALVACARPGGTGIAAHVAAATLAAEPPPAGLRSAPDAAKVPPKTIDVGRPQDLADLVASRPDIFVGLGVERRGVVIVALNPGVDPATWRPVVARYAGRTSHLVTVCPHSYDDLQNIVTELTARQWSPRATSISFAVAPDPVTCSVQLSTDQLTDAEATSLTARYGDALTLVDVPVERS